MHGRKSIFKWVYFIYLVILAAFVLTAVLYVRSLLRKYEAFQPEVRVREAVDALAAAAADGTFWERYPFQGITPGEYEGDLRERYCAGYAGGELAFSRMPGGREGELLYAVKCGERVLAQVRLKAMGPPVTKLAIFSYREWAVESVQPVLASKDYALSLPEGLDVRVNGIDAPPEQGTAESGGVCQYRFAGLYLEPVIEVADHYGNVIRYESGDELPLTYITITAADQYTVFAEGAPVPEQDIETWDNPEYDFLKEYAAGLPRLARWRLAILKKDAEITLRDGQGNSIPLKPGESSYDFSKGSGASDVPAAVAERVDVLDVAKKWSLFLSRDLDFAQLQPYLLKGSVQHDVALKYARSIDITFISDHTLLDPPFTDILVANFNRITDACFSVDISFVKHMYLTTTEQYVDDAINDRFYFVQYDDTKDGVDNPAWKLVGMKEIFNGRTDE